MKKVYMQPSTKAIEIKVEKSLLTAISGGDAKTEFGPGTGEQPTEGIPTVNSRSSYFTWDDEEY